MPLIQGKSKKAFQKNVETEMKANPGPKHKAQNLAIAYSVKRRATNKKASGGTVKSGSKDMNMAKGGEISSSNEKRPMPDNIYADSNEVSRNRGNKPSKNDSWTDNITLEQAQKPSPAKPSRPPLKGSDAFSVRYRDEIEQDNNRMISEAPNEYDNQPKTSYNEDEASRQGSSINDMEDEHSTHTKPYKKEVEDQYTQDEASDDMKQQYAKGGEISPNDSASHNINMRTTMEPKDDSMSEYERGYEAGLQSKASPSEDSGTLDAKSRNEESPNRQGDEVSDMEDEHTTGSKPYADGGTIQFKDNQDNIDMDQDDDLRSHSLDDTQQQSEDEVEEENHNSIAAAIMAKRHMDQEDDMSGSIDEDDAEMYAKGGNVNDSASLDNSAASNPVSRLDAGFGRVIARAKGGEILEDSPDIHSHRSMDSDNSSQVDLTRNADEDANEEDQTSFDALRKENYNTSFWDTHQPYDSNTRGDDEAKDSMDKHDMISSIRSKMNKKRQFSNR